MISPLQVSNPCPTCGPYGLAQCRPRRRLRWFTASRVGPPLGGIAPLEVSEHLRALPWVAPTPGEWISGSLVSTRAHEGARAHGLTG